METKTWAKRVAAVTTGALMLGATLMGAMAYDLKDFPAPFVANGMLSDTVIVVGAAADTADVLGSVDIAAALQAAAKTPAGSGTTTEATATAGKKIDKSGDAFNYNEDIYDVVPETFDEGDLPELLADVEFNDNEGENTQDEDYSQELSFTNGNAEFVFETPDDGVAGNYVKVTDGAGLYTYTLEFDSAIDYDTADAEDDLVGTKLEIMGKTYTITDVSLDNSDFIDSVTMVAGDSTVWLAMDHPLEFGGDTITVVDVADDGTKCGVDVNGHVEWVSEGTTSDAFPSDLSVGVLEAVETASEGGNACELSLGSAELLFTEGDEVDMNGELIDGTTVDFTHDAAGEWTGFTVTYETEFDGSDDVYLAAGDAWTDPVFGTFKVHFAGVNANYEDMAWSASGDDATFTFTNNDGKDVEVAWHRETGTTLGLGWADDEPLLLPGENSSAVVFDTTDLTNVRMLYTTSGGEAHVLRVKALDCEDSTKNTTDIYDETYDRYVVEDKEVVCDDTFNVIALGSLGSINLSINSAATVLKYDDDADTGDGTPESEFEGTFVFNNTGLSFTEKDGDEADYGKIAFNFAYDSTDEEIYNSGVSFSAMSPTPTWVETEDGNNDEEQTVTPKGTLLVRDTDEMLSFTMQHPEEDAFAEIFVTPLTATVSSTSSGGDAFNVHPFEVGLAVLDTDAESMSKNMVIVGGPCANTIAAEVMSNPADCAAGFEEGKAMVKYFTRSGKAALLVAGYSAKDTRGASYVLADYGKYGLEGDEVEVVSTNLADLKVNKV